MKLKSFCTSKDTINQLKRQPTKQEKKIFTRYTSDRVSVSRLYKKQNKPNIKKINNTTKSRAWN